MKRRRKRPEFTAPPVAYAEDALAILAESPDGITPEDLAARLGLWAGRTGRAASMRASLTRVIPALYEDDDGRLALSPLVTWEVKEAW